MILTLCKATSANGTLDSRWSLSSGRGGHFVVYLGQQMALYFTIYIADKYWYLLTSFEIQLLMIVWGFDQSTLGLSLRK